jgi:hypothetical protein
MKNKTNTRSTSTIANPFSHRPSGVRSSTAKSLEHRYLRRKIHERLRHLDWALDTDDEPLS